MDSTIADIIFLRTPISPLHLDPYHSSCITSNFTPHHLPVLTTSHTNLSSLHAITKEGLSTRYSGVIITSARAVNAWAASYSLPDATVQPGPATTIPFFTVGKATRDAVISKSGLKLDPDQVLGAEETGTGDKLASFIVEYYAGKETKPELPLLYLVGDKNREAIEERLKQDGLKVERLQVYETTKADDFEESLEGILRGLGCWDESERGRGEPRRVVWIALFSPSGAKHCLRVLRQHQLLPLNGQPIDSNRTVVRLAAIGPTTRAFLEEEEGLTTHAVAGTPEAGELVRAIQDAGSHL